MEPTSCTALDPRTWTPASTWVLSALSPGLLTPQTDMDREWREDPVARPVITDQKGVSR